MSEDSSAEKKLTVKVDEGDKLTIDGTEEKIEELKADFFENLVDKALANEVDFVLESNGIAGNFFQTIQSGTTADSDLRKLYEKTLTDNKVSDEDDSKSSDAQKTKSATEAEPEAAES
jgi:hypothetical protein